MRLLSRTEVESLIGMPEAIEAARIAYRAIADGSALVPLRHHLKLPDNGVGLIMPGYLPDSHSYGVKVVSVIPNNRHRNLPVTLGAVLLLDPHTGEPVSLMDGTYLTALRTGAGTGAATDALARRDARVLALIGAGGQAPAQLDAILAVRPVETVYVVSRTPASARAFCERQAQRLAAEHASPPRLVVGTSAEEAVRRADLVVTCSSASEPVLNGRWLQPGTHVSAVGSHSPRDQEIDVETVRRAGLRAVDSVEGAVVSADLQVPLQQGVLARDDLIEIGRILAGSHSGRKDDREITFFKSVGHASQDLATARWIYEKACEQGVGTRVDL